MQDKIKQYIQEIFYIPKKKNRLIRKNLFPIVKDINNIIWKDDSLYSINNYTMIFLDLLESGQYFKVISQIKADNKNLSSQLFYKNKDEENFTEENSIWLGNADEDLKINYFNTGKLINEFRLNPINGDGKFSIEYFEIIKISAFEYYYQLVNNIRKGKISSKNLKKVLNHMRHYGIKTTLNKVLYKIQLENKNVISYKQDKSNSQNTIKTEITKIDSYSAWQNVNKCNNNYLEYIKKNLENCKYKPLISIVIPIYNPPLKFLKKAIESVKGQIYTNWEICIVDDCSTNTFVKPFLQKLEEEHKNIFVKFNKSNMHISKTTNEAVKMANGEYLVFLDQDDELTKDALAEIILYINKHKNTDLLYSDDDKIDTDGKCFAPQFKPDWSPEYLLSFMYCGHLKCVKKILFEKIGGFRVGFEGSQDYDFYLRASEIANHIGHIPKILYHWRVIPGSTASSGGEKHYSFEAGVKAVQEALTRRGVEGEVYHPEWALKTGVGIYAIKFPDNGKSVAIIIPTKNGYELLRRCIKSLKKTTYKNYKIYIINNESDDKKTLKYLDELKQYCNVLDIPSQDGKFSFSYINNKAVEFIKEELILFLNNDTEVINPRWLSQMVGYIQFKGVGSVGARLLFPNDTIQHAGIIHGLTHEFPITSGRNLPKWDWGYMASTITSKNFSAVTAACMLTSKKLFTQLGGFDDKDFSVAFNDCDYGYKLYKLGYRNVLAPEAELYHYEGASRGHGDKPSEESVYIRKYGDWKDPYYNPNLALNCSDYSIDSKNVVLHKVPKFRLLMVTHNLNLEGAPKSFYELAKGLKRSDFIEPVIISHRDGPLKELYSDEDIEVNIIEDFNLFSLFELKDIKRFLSKQINLIKTLNIDVIYGNTIESFWAIQCAKELNLPSIWNIRESEEPFSPYSHNIHIKNLMIESLKYPYKVIFVADATKQVYEHLNTQNNFMTIYNGFDKELVKQKTKTLAVQNTRKKLGIKDNELSILTVGTVCERKGQIDLVQAIKNLENKYINKLKFFIVGDRKTLNYSKRMHRLIEQLPKNKQERIEVIDETPDVHQYYLACDIFICSSRVESFPKVIQEAMYYKLAIITTPVYGIVEQVKDNISALYYSPADIEKLVSSIKKLVDNKNIRDHISQNAKTALDILPTIQEMSLAYEEVFKEAWLSGGSR